MEDVLIQKLFENVFADNEIKAPRNLGIIENVTGR